MIEYLEIFKDTTFLIMVVMFCAVCLAALFFENKWLDERKKRHNLENSIRKEDEL